MIAVSSAASACLGFLGGLSQVNPRRRLHWFALRSLVVYIIYPERAEGKADFSFVSGTGANRSRLRARLVADAVDRSETTPRAHQQRI